jgi:hypothetical protein
MAYHSDPDGPVIDKGALRARIIEVCGIVFVAGLIIFIVLKVMRPESKRKESAVDISKVELRYSPYFYSIDSSDDVLTVSLWESGLTAASKKAYDGDSEAVAEWNKTKYNVLQYANAIDTNLILNDVEGMTVFVQVVNEDNHERKLLVFKNCELVYDVTKGE